ncbi:MAG TPA: hypothetical protein VGP93_06135, partial [Polyangiaceae bacterium]|nr:hypothetical protein [Polyangiaceae bacterium]
MARRSLKTDTALAWLRRQLPLPDYFGLASPLVANIFTELRIGVALWHPPFDWNVVHKEKDVIALEIEHGQERQRWAYNERCFMEVQRTRAMVRGEHAGFHDLFVPVLDASGVCAVFVAGPFLRERPTAAAIVERWFSLTRSQAKLGDPGFAQYVTAMLATLTLEGALSTSFERLMGCFAELAGGQGKPRALLEEAKALRMKLIEARSAERMWEVVPSLIDERLARSWAAPDQAQSLWETGLRRLPGPMAVGLVAGRTSQSDAIDELLRRDAFQRAAVVLARKAEGVACGRVSDLGVVLLTDDAGSGPRVRAKLSELATRVAALGRRFGFKLHFGVGLPKDAESLPTRYLVALSAAQRAVSKDASMIHGEPRPEHSAKHLRKVRQQLVEGVGDGRTLSARFEHYTQTVLEHCGYR